MKKIFISLAILVGIIGLHYKVDAVSVFNSNQVGTSPVNGYYLQTNGATSTWAAVSGGSSTISINGVSSTVFTLNSSTYLGITASGTAFTFTNLGVQSFNGATGTITFSAPSSTVNLTGSSTPNAILSWLNSNGSVSGTSSAYCFSNGDCTFGTSTDFGPFGVVVPNATSTENGTPSGALAPVSSSSLMVDANGQVQSNDVGLYPNTLPTFFYPSSTVITTFQAGNPFTLGANGTSTASTTNYVKGNQSEFITTSGSANVTAYSATNQGPYNFTGKYLELWLNVQSSTPMTYLQFYLTSNNSFTGATAQYEEWVLSNLESSDPDSDYLPAGQWVQVILPMAADGSNIIVSTSTFNLGAIDGFRLQSEDKGGGATFTVGINGIAMVSMPSTGLVSLTFDDGYLSSYTLANQEMSLYGYPGSVFDIPINTLTLATSTYMTVAQMQILQNQNNWDIDCHTYDHPETGEGIGNFTATQLNYEYLACKNFLIDNGFNSGANILAYPGGDTSPLATLYAQKYFSMARGAVQKIPETFPPGNPYYLRAVEINASTTTSTILSDLTNCQVGDEWCIFEMHDITTSTSPNQYQVTTSTFNYLITEINSLSLPVVTMSQVLKASQDGASFFPHTTTLTGAVTGSGATTIATTIVSPLNLSTINASTSNITNLTVNNTSTFLGNVSTTIPTGFVYSNSLGILTSTSSPVSTSTLGFATSSLSISSCGTGSPTVTGSSNMLYPMINFSAVTGASASACTITFPTVHFVSTPVCTISDSNTTAVADISSVSSSSITISLASALSAVNLYGICTGNPN